MGGSSKQVTGYKYSTSFILFIGNAIEKVLGINFDKRGWQTPLIDENKNALPHGIIDAPFLYGSNEGGVSGGIHARYGTATQEPVEFYADYLAKSEIPPLAYQHQSYLAFEDFYVGNSGYMKEMLLWLKRTRKKSDGSEQWYQTSIVRPWVCECGLLKRVTPAGSQDFKKFDILLDGKVTWIDPNGEHFASWSTGKFPFYDIEQSYDTNDVKLNVKPSLIAVQPLLAQHGIVIDEGTVLPPCTWSDYPPKTDGFWNGAIDRSYLFSSEFYWEGGVFKYKAILSENNATITILKRNGSLLDRKLTLNGFLGSGYVFREGEIFLEKGVYQINVDTGDRYMLVNTPRPFAHLLTSATYLEVDAPDINPIHKIREILTDRTAMNKPESEINDANFMKAADRIWDEGLGISWAIQEKSCIEALNELCYHIEAGIRVNRQTGLYEMVLFRDDWFDESEIHTLTENKIKSIELEVQNGYEVVNQLNVNFYDRQNIKNSSFSVAENASIRNLNGKVNAETVDFPYFMNQRNAEIVAKWKLKQFASAGWKGSFTTSERQARKWNRYDIVKINWSKKGISSLPVRILSLKFGKHASSTVTIEFEEVVSALGNLSTSIIIDDSIDNSVQPPKPCNAKVFELSYFEAVQANGEREINGELTDNPEAGFVCAIAEKPQNNSLNAALYINDGGGFEKSATINYCETAYLDSSINKITSSFVVKNAGNLASVRIGSQIFINDEIMVYQSFDAQTNVLIVKRGALDTVPQNHDADSILYFADDFVAIDQTLYVSGERIEAKVLTTTPSGILNINDTETHIVELNSRAIRPYPPANVKINDEYFPQEIESDLVLTWVDRNRKQQTGGEIIGFVDQGVVKESGVSYKINLYDGESNHLLLSQENVTSPLVIPKSTMAVRNILELYSVRDGFESASKYICEFTKSSTEIWTPANNESIGVWIEAQDAVVDANNRVISVNSKTASGAVFTSSGSGMPVKSDLELNAALCFSKDEGHTLYSPNALTGLGNKKHQWTFIVIKCTSRYGTSGDSFIANSGNHGYGVARRGDYSTFKPSFYFKTASNQWVLHSSPIDIANDWCMIMLYCNLEAGTHEIYIDGSIISSGLNGVTGLTTSLSEMMIGGTSSTFEFDFPILMCGAEDISPDIQKIFGWAAHKYNLTSKLPPDHPYKTEVPKT